MTRLPFRAPCKDVAGLYAWHDGKKVPLPPPAPIVHHDVLTAKNKGKHEASSKVKTAEADKTKKAGSGKAAAHTTKLASGKSGAHASKAARQTAKKDIDAIQLAARKHHHKSPAHKPEEHKRERVAHQ